MDSSTSHSKVDESVIEALENYEVQYNVADWDRMEGLLTKLPTQTPLINKSYSSIIAISVGSVVAILILYAIFKSEDTPPVVEKKNVEQEIINLNTTIDNIIGNQPIDSIKIIEPAVTTQPTITKKKEKRRERRAIKTTETKDTTSKEVVPEIVEQKKVDSAKKKVELSKKVEETPTVKTVSKVINKKEATNNSNNDSTTLLEEATKIIDSSVEIEKEKKVSTPFQKRVRKGT